MKGIEKCTKEDGTVKALLMLSGLVWSGHVPPVTGKRTEALREAQAKKEQGLPYDTTEFEEVYEKIIENRNRLPKSCLKQKINHRRKSGISMHIISCLTNNSKKTEKNENKL